MLSIANQKKLERMEQQIAELQEEVARLKAEKRGPGRPKKEEDKAA